MVIEIYDLWPFVSQFEFFALNTFQNIYCLTFTPENEWNKYCYFEKNVLLLQCYFTQASVLLLKSRM